MSDYSVYLTHTGVPEMSEAELSAAREWAAECLSDTHGKIIHSGDVTDVFAAQYVQRWYGGGVKVFKRDVEIGGF